MTALSPSSKVTISLLITLLGGAAFITKIYFQTEANASTIKELKTDIKDDLKEIKVEIRLLRENLEDAKH